MIETPNKIFLYWPLNRRTLKIITLSFDGTIMRRSTRLAGMVEN